MKPPSEHNMRFSSKTQCWQSGFKAGSGAANGLAQLVKELASTLEAEENGNICAPSSRNLLVQAFKMAKRIKKETEQ